MPTLQDDDLEAAVERGIISRDQAGALRAFARERHLADVPPPAKFSFINVAYYFGALLVIGAMGFFMTLGWESFGGGGLLTIALTYAALFIAAGHKLGKIASLRVPSGLLYTMAVGMTPLAVYGLERWTGLWPESDPGNYRGFNEWVKGGWFAMELATVVVGVIAARLSRFPFITALISFTLWYMSMDLAPLLFGKQSSYGYVQVDWNVRCLVSATVGAFILLSAYLVDRRTVQDYAFWLYLFGMAAFWGGLSAMESSSELRKFGYCVLNLGFIVLSVLLDRRVLATFQHSGIRSLEFT